MFLNALFINYHRASSIASSAAEAAALHEPALALSQTERLQLSMRVRHISVLVATQALYFQHMVCGIDDI
jgi:hypothetical protein